MSPTKAIVIKLRKKGVGRENYEKFNSRLRRLHLVRACLIDASSSYPEI